MKYDKVFRNPDKVRQLSMAINRVCKHSWHIMEICGGQTHALAKYKIEELLPDKIRMIHGPGCPVCVTPVGIIDMALSLARRENVILVSFGDMMRVPGSKDDLLTVRAEGGDIRMVYSPLDALTIAQNNPNKEVVFFAIGFETTAPIHALTIEESYRRKITNFSLLTSLFLVPPAIYSLMSDKDCQLDGILAAGHVCSITGIEEYRNLALSQKVPVAITGFEPFDLLYGIYKCVLLLENKQYIVENAYSRAVTFEGNVKARQLMRKYFSLTNVEWRGLGTLPLSGLCIRDKYEQYDATKRFQLKTGHVKKERFCVSGEIMKGKMLPDTCIHFGKRCTPEHPLGAAMVSSEGVCSAFYRYKI